MQQTDELCVDAVTLIFTRAVTSDAPYRYYYYSTVLLQYFCACACVIVGCDTDSQDQIRTLPASAFRVRYLAFKKVVGRSVCIEITLEFCVTQL
eukprot:COSAG02_NODE_28846_length_581_cov_0.850622_1_plen_94_part_00